MPGLPDSTRIVHAARTDTLEAAVAMLRIEEQLRRTFATLPPPPAAVVESEQAPDVGANLRGTIAYVLAEHVSVACAELLQAATATGESLEADFTAWKESEGR